MKFVFGQHAQGGGYRFFWRIRFLVALTPVWDLLLFAKNLFVEAMVAENQWRPLRSAASRALNARRQPLPLRRPYEPDEVMSLSEQVMVVPLQQLARPAPPGLPVAMPPRPLRNSLG